MSALLALVTRLLQLLRLLLLMTSLDLPCTLLTVHIALGKR